ncbi:MAG: PCRF domain-containing protein, partial [Acidobacteriota bacterium]
MDEKLQQIENRFEELQEKISDPGIVSDLANYRATMKAVSDIQEVVEKYRELKIVRKRLAETREMLTSLKGDDELRELAELDLAELQEQEPELLDQLRLLLQPKDPNDDRNVFVEIRAGTGGDEASLFASEVMRMYVRYAELKRWKVDVT